MDERTAKVPRLNGTPGQKPPPVKSEASAAEGRAKGAAAEGAADGRTEGRGRPQQEKRTCPACGTRVGPRFGTGKDGEGNQCPGSVDSQRCTYIFAAGRKKLAHKQLVEKCAATASGPLAEVKAAQTRAFRKVVAEAAKTGGNAVLVWYNPVNEDENACRDLNRMLLKTGNKAPAGPHEAEYAFRVVGAVGGHAQCGVVLQASTGTEAADAILEKVAAIVNPLAVKHLQKIADKAALEAITSPPVAQSSVPSGRGAGSSSARSGGGTKGQTVLSGGSAALQDLEAYLQTMGLSQACYEPLSKNGLTLDVMRAIIAANGREMPAFVDALKLVGISAGHSMVIFANLNKVPI